MKEHKLRFNVYVITMNRFNERSNIGIVEILQNEGLKYKIQNLKWLFSA